MERNQSHLEVWFAPDRLLMTVFVRFAAGVGWLNAGRIIERHVKRTSIVLLYHCKRSFICSVTRLKNLSPELRFKPRPREGESLTPKEM